ncbi:MAG TPA: nuclear transport factor 2 family protein [Myxococcota bacterium]|nr:nuclear transport factor 2 family protein [Myxococcota bacterium]
MTQEERNRALVLRFWDTVYVARDYDAVGRFFTEDGLYQDVSAPDPGGVGPAGVSRRLRIGHEPVQAFDHEIHRMICQGDVVMTEHTETWKFHTGEVIPLPFVSVQVIRGDKIALWRDYSDLTQLLGKMPKWWLEHIAKAASAPELAPAR